MMPPDADVAPPTTPIKSSTLHPQAQEDQVILSALQTLYQSPYKGNEAKADSKAPPLPLQLNITGEPPIEILVQESPPSRPSGPTSFLSRSPSLGAQQVRAQSPPPATGDAQAAKIIRDMRRAPGDLLAALTQTRTLNAASPRQKKRVLPDFAEDAPAAKKLAVPSLGGQHPSPSQAPKPPSKNAFPTARMPGILARKRKRPAAKRQASAYNVQSSPTEHSQAAVAIPGSIPPEEAETFVSDKKKVIQTFTFSSQAHGVSVRSEVGSMMQTCGPVLETAGPVEHAKEEPEAYATTGAITTGPVKQTTTGPVKQTTTGPVRSEVGGPVVHARPVRQTATGPMLQTPTGPVRQISNGPVPQGPWKTHTKEKAPMGAKGGTPPSVRSKTPKANTGEDTCNCKKSKCLKLYCDCFAKSRLCTDSCHCKDCMNMNENNKRRLEAIKACTERNAYAFQDKVSQKVAGTGQVQHSTGCRCKRSACLKKYCECFAREVLCGDKCRCIGCGNQDKAAMKRRPNPNKLDYRAHRVTPTPPPEGQLVPTGSSGPDESDSDFSHTGAATGHLSQRQSSGRQAIGSYGVDHHRHSATRGYQAHQGEDSVFQNSHRDLSSGDGRDNMHSTQGMQSLPPARLMYYPPFAGYRQMPASGGSAMPIPRPLHHPPPGCFLPGPGVSAPLPMHGVPPPMPGMLPINQPTHHAHKLLSIGWKHEDESRNKIKGLPVLSGDCTERLKVEQGVNDKQSPLTSFIYIFRTNRPNSREGRRYLHQPPPFSSAYLKGQDLRRAPAASAPLAPTAQSVYSRECQRLTRRSQVGQIVGGDEKLFMFGALAMEKKSIVHIFAHLAGEDTYNACLVSKAWKKMAFDDALWFRESA
ncbi:unnamed protein product [Chrysoparadoxa australica]